MRNIYIPRCALFSDFITHSWITIHESEAGRHSHVREWDKEGDETTRVQRVRDDARIVVGHSLRMNSHSHWTHNTSDWSTVTMHRDRLLRSRASIGRATSAHFTTRISASSATNQHAIPGYGMMRSHGTGDAAWRDATRRANKADDRENLTFSDAAADNGGLHDRVIGRFRSPGTATARTRTDRRCRRRRRRRCRHRHHRHHRRRAALWWRIRGTVRRSRGNWRNWWNYRSALRCTACSPRTRIRRGKAKPEIASSSFALDASRIALARLAFGAFVCSGRRVTGVAASSSLSGVFRVGEVRVAGERGCISWREGEGMKVERERERERERECVYVCMRARARACVSLTRYREGFYWLLPRPMSREAFLAVARATATRGAIISNGRQTVDGLNGGGL